MIPWRELDRARAPDGGQLSLHQRGDEFVIRIDGGELMSSRRHASEKRLAELGCETAIAAARPRVLIGGLGMGFTLRAALDLLPGDAEVVVAEIADCVVAWNRGVLAHLTDGALSDPRVTVRVADVGRLLRTAKTRFHAILLDVDNGPQGMTRAANQALYTEPGLTVASRALHRDGSLAVWSAAHHPDFVRRMKRVGLVTEVHRVRARDRGGPKHTIYVGRPPAGQGAGVMTKR